MHDSWADYYDFINEQPFRRTYHLLTERTLQLIDRAGPARGTVLDLGAGIGRLSIPPAARGYNVTAVELSRKMVQRLKAKASSASVELDVVSQPIQLFRPEPDRYDLALAVFTMLSYLPDEEALQVLGRMLSRALKPGGRFICDLAPSIAFQSRRYETDGMTRDVDISLLPSGRFRYHESPEGMMDGKPFRYEDSFEIRRWTIEEIEPMLAGHGLRLLGRCETSLGSRDGYQIFTNAASDMA